MAKPDTNMDYDAIFVIRQNRKSRRENEKKYKNKTSRLEREWDDYDEMEYGYKEKEEY